MNDPGPKADVPVGPSFQFVSLPENRCQEFGGTRERAVHSKMLALIEGDDRG